jgi:hypothetical protein
MDGTQANMEQQWNDNDREKSKNLEKNLFQRHFVHQKSCIDYPGVNPSLYTEKLATNCLCYDTVPYIYVTCTLYFK